jgi:predicted dinucleotide-binding enzyme
MRIGVLGTGVVGTTIATALVQREHDVKLGARSTANAKAAEWVKAAGAHATQGTFAEAASFGDIVFNCTSGTASLDALRAAGAESLGGKPLIDVANPLDFSRGMPPSLSVCNTDSLAEQIQRAFPGAKVVKALNTVNANVMVNPGVVPGEHDVFICGNDSGAKAATADLLQSFGWTNIIDLGDIGAARGTEMLLPIWLRLWGTFKTPHINFHIARAPG